MFKMNKGKCGEIGCGIICVILFMLCCSGVAFLVSFNIRKGNVLLADPGVTFLVSFNIIKALAVALLFGFFVLTYLFWELIFKLMEKKPEQKTDAPEKIQPASSKKTKGHTGSGNPEH